MYFIICFNSVDNTPLKCLLLRDFPTTYTEAVVQRCSVKKGALKIFPKFTEKHLCDCLFNEEAGLRPATLLKSRLWHRCFPVNFANFFRKPFL